MSIIGWTTLKCPYCGFENTYHMEDEEANKTAIFICDNEEGGCDKPFVWRNTVKIISEVFKIAFDDDDETKDE